MLLFSAFAVFSLTGAVQQSSFSTANPSVTSRSVPLDIPLRLYSVKRPIDGSWQSISIEFSYMADYFGNLTCVHFHMPSWHSTAHSYSLTRQSHSSHPNQLSSNLLTLLQTTSHSPLIIRVGGSTANIALFNASQPLAVTNIYDGSTNIGLEGAPTDQPSLTTLGPAWFEAFQTAPVGTRFIYDLNYRDNSTAGVQATVDVARRVWEALGEGLLYAFEIGNEMEKWGGLFRDDGWGPREYVDEYLRYAALIEEAVWGLDGDNGSQVQPFFQMGAFMGSGNESVNQPWNSEVVLGLGINRKQQIRSASQHDVSAFFFTPTPVYNLFLPGPR